MKCDLDGNMMTKYPLLLVHGAGLRDKTYRFIEYWGRIPKTFSKNGIAFYHGETDAWGTIEKNAEILKARIDAILKERGTEKVNIIAHSRGGLEARYLIANMGMERAVASLTTISTPHRGVKAMNIALKLPVALYKFCSFFVDAWYKALGDKNPDFFASSRQLSEKSCAEFNERNPDMKGIYYQSYAAMLKYFFGDIILATLNQFIKLTDGGNDGLCPVESAKWGDYKGTITTEGIFGISHGGIIDLYRTDYKGVSIPDFYLGIAKGLSERGL